MRRCRCSDVAVIFAGPFLTEAHDISSVSAWITTLTTTDPTPPTVRPTAIAMPATAAEKTTTVDTDDDDAPARKSSDPALFSRILVLQMTPFPHEATRCATATVLQETAFIICRGGSTTGRAFNLH